MRPASIVVLALVTGCAGGPSRWERGEERIRATPDAEVVSVAYVPIANGDPTLIRAHERLHAASTMKLPVLMEAYRRVAAGELDLATPIVVRNGFHSIVDGSEFALKRS